MILNLFHRDGKDAIITGAGRGIGAASAMALAELGVVVIAFRIQSDLDKVIGQVVVTGRRAASDLDDLDVVRFLVTTAQREFGRLDFMVINVEDTIRHSFAIASG
jgi:7-alpha-hydroxysteroid dehydrogenase